MIRYAEENFIRSLEHRARIGRLSGRAERSWTFPAIDEGAREPIESLRHKKMLRFEPVRHHTQKANAHIDRIGEPS
jgi:hypothetical protein